MKTTPSPTEQAILDCLRVHAGPVEVRTILGDVWGYRYIDEGGITLLRTHIYNLRRKGFRLRATRQGVRPGTHGYSSYEEARP